MPQETDFHIRNFQAGDEEGILRVFEKCYAEYAGYVVRTPEYWRWCCLERPDVETNGVFVAVRGSDEKVLGYVVAGKSGNIWELGYDRESSCEGLVKSLLENAVEYLTSVGVSVVNFQAPAGDLEVGEVCGSLGLVEARSSEVFVSVLDFSRLLLLLASNQGKKFRDLDEGFGIILKDAPGWMNGKFGIRIKEGGVSFLEETQKPAFLVETDVSTLSAMLFGRASPFWAWFRFSVKVKPFWKLPRFLELISGLKLAQPWFVPLSDYG